MSLWNSIAGVLNVELTSAEPEAALAALNAQGIEIIRIRQVSDLTCCFCIHRRDYKILSKLAKKRGETLRIIDKSGLYWMGKALFGRPVLLLGIAFLLAVVLYLPTRVFFVRVEGAESVPERTILAAAEENGIRFGASRREVRSEKVKNAILAAIPELQWAGVNTSGCVATISVRERTEQQPSNSPGQVTSIVAARDGYILSGTVTQGNALFHVGQTVKEGQVLISGYTDCGICIQATRSEGEIFAQTNHNLIAITPSVYTQRVEIQDVKRKYSLIIRKKRINLWKDSGISDTSCGRMYEEYYVTLPGGFQLPVALCVEEYHFYDTQQSEMLQEDAETLLADFAERYLTQQMIAGDIQSRSQAVTMEDGFFILQGNYVCVEMIGRVQQEQIGDSNGKDD